MSTKNDEIAPYALFQGEDGKWGVKDRNGAIVYDATYIRQTGNDGEDTFYDGSSQVCVFSPEDGFFPIAFWDLDFLVWLSEENDDAGENSSEKS